MQFVLVGVTYRISRYCGEPVARRWACAAPSDPSDGAVRCVRALALALTLRLNNSQRRDNSVAHVLHLRAVRGMCACMHVSVLVWSICGCMRPVTAARRLLRALAKVDNPEVATRMYIGNSLRIVACAHIDYLQVLRNSWVYCKANSLRITCPIFRS